MAVLRIRQLGDPVLRERSRPVIEFDAALRGLAEDMAETMYDAPGVGLAANQIGRAIRLFVWDDQSGEGWHAVANPEVDLLEGEEEYEEGCLSIPGLFFSRKRALRVRLRGHDLDGRGLDVEVEAFRARIFQHETDHVNGALFVDALEGDARVAWMRTLRERELGLSL